MSKPRLCWFDFYGNRASSEAEILKLQAKSMAGDTDKWDQLAEQVVEAAKVFIAARTKKLEERVATLESKA